MNPPPARAHADVGIAIGGGADVAEATAPVVLLNGGLWKIPVVIDISRECMTLIRQNWTIISVPNTVALGAALVEGIGVGAVTVLNNGSAILATGNALRPLMADRVQWQSYSTARMARSRTSSVTDRRSHWDTWL
jgi:cation transport ATPase